MSHTEGKLHIDQYGNIKTSAGDRWDSLFLRGVTLPMCAGEEMEEAKANARRLVACWNACDGIPIEQLECDQPTFVRMLLERQTLKKERDELLKALRRLTFAARTGGGVAGRDEHIASRCFEAEAILSRYQAESEEKN